jgi:hypothetical protein
MHALANGHAQLGEPRKVVPLTDQDRERPIRLVDTVITLREAAERPEPEYRSLFRAGGMPLGFYSIVHGPGGIGKTREILRMMARRVLRMPWHCWEPSDEQFKPLVLSLEMGLVPAAKILKQIALDLGGSEVWEAVAAQVRIGRAQDDLDPLHAGLDAREQLIETIQKFDANFVLIDSVSEILGGTGGDTPEDYSPTMEMLKFVARTTKTHLCVIHHNRRLPAGARNPDAPADQIRGPAAFVNASRWACAMDMHRGKRRITWHRVSFGPTPPVSFFRIDGSGIPQDDFLVEATNTGEINRAKVLAAIPPFGGISRRALQQATGLSESAVGDHLRELVQLREVVKGGSGSRITYGLPISRPPELLPPGSET